MSIHVKVGKDGIKYKGSTDCVYIGLSFISMLRPLMG